MNETAQDGKDDIGIYEESLCSASSHTLPGSPKEGEVTEEGKEMKNRIIKREEKAVRDARLLVAAAIIACAVAVSTAIYVFALNSDQTTFELEVSNNRRLLCSCSIVFPTNGSNLIPSPYLMTPLFSMKATFRILLL
jgi:hypothetical protein